MRLRLLFVLLVLAISVPFAAADSILNLTFNNLGITGSVGTVDLHQEAGGVLVTLTANSGYSFKLNGGDILFNSTVTIGGVSGVTADVYSPSFSFSGHGPQAVGSFNNDLRNLKISSPHGYVSAGTISFFISGVQISQLGNFGVHFCTASGSKCGPQTGFASTGPVVPEPGTLSLLGTGILGLAGFFRRRLLS